MLIARISQRLKSTFNCDFFWIDDARIIFFFIIILYYLTIIIHFGSTTYLLLFRFWSASDNKHISLAFFIQSIYIKSENAQWNKFTPKKVQLIVDFSLCGIRATSTCSYYLLHYFKFSAHFEML